MATICFLLDEHVPEALADALVREKPAIEVYQVGQDPAPVKGTLDRELLRVAEAKQWMVLTQDKSTMPRHVVDHLAAGHHTWGVFFLRDDATIRRLVDDLLLMWSASQAEDWRDVMDWLPW
jgi:hypothetical protein